MGRWREGRGQAENAETISTVSCYGSADRALRATSPSPPCAHYPRPDGLIDIGISDEDKQRLPEAINRFRRSTSSWLTPVEANGMVASVRFCSPYAGQLIVELITIGLPLLWKNMPG